MADDGHREKRLLRFLSFYWTCSVVLFLIFLSTSYSNSQECGTKPCFEGECINGSCVCSPGWGSASCEHCEGRVRFTDLTGTITDGHGNYTEDNKCTWLIDTGNTNHTVRLQLHQFSTECGWDHLYIYDGDSAYSPLLAAFSGLIKQSANSGEDLPEITTHSGKAYLYFYSDAAYNMSGFNITYRIDGCVQQCSHHGDCVDGQCVCWSNWTGEACQTPVCPNNCSDNGTCVNSKCICSPGLTGPDCSVPTENGMWEMLEEDNSFQGRASSGVLRVGDNIYMAGGYTLNKMKHFMMRYNLSDTIWHTVEPLGISPTIRYGHSIDAYQDKLYMYGGIEGVNTSRELWIYDINTNTWTLRLYNDTLPVGVAGHSAHIVRGVMYVFFGYSPVYGYKNRVQEYHIGNDTWVVPRTTGALVRGGYGHSSVYDPHTDQVYVYGGYLSKGSNSYELTDNLYAYKPSHRLWTELRKNDLKRYLHSAVIIDGIMLVYGGNTHNDTSVSHGAKCYSKNLLAYNIRCNSWYSIDAALLPKNGARYGHSSITYRKDGSETLLVVGGFNGIMLNNILQFTPGNCSQLTEKEKCISSKQGRECVWVNSAGCMALSELSDLGLKTENHNVELQECNPKDGNKEKCKAFKSCPTCLSTRYGCVWCNNSCNATCDSTSIMSIHTAQNLSECRAVADPPCEVQHMCRACVSHQECQWKNKKCDLSPDYQIAPSDPNTTYMSNDTEIYSCPDKFSSVCGLTDNCFSCIQSSSCQWKHNSKQCVQKKYVIGERADSQTDYDLRREKQCKKPCYLNSDCSNCTRNGCMWCSNQQKCVETNSYVASFIYGQCMEWTTDKDKCSATRCADLHTCSSCQSNPLCGWCNDPSNTGIGRCMEGGAQGPVNPQNTSQLEPMKCLASQWFFINCPLCQCNGHSTCLNGTGTCEECQDMTQGSQCERCQDGYYGNPTNGRNCTACQCNEQADMCNHKSGSCYCRTRGVIGEKCDKCDVPHKYFGDPKKGTCYYHLVTDYQFTFNLSKKDDQFYTQINFMNIPSSSDRDVDFKVNCSGHALLNITYKTNSMKTEKVYVDQHACSSFRTKFQHGDYPFGSSENTTFLVYVYGFKTPFWLQISFSQFPKIDLVHFFVTFFSCFLALLIIAAVLYKIKHKYDIYRRRQRMMVEMEEMASRPFATITLDIDRKYDNCGAEKKDINTDLRKRKKISNKPSQVAQEPLSHQKAAVISLVVQLPTGDEEWTPNGASGVAIASALVSIGHHRKQSVEHGAKGDKNKSKKHSFPLQPDACV